MGCEIISTNARRDNTFRRTCAVVSRYFPEIASKIGGNFQQVVQKEPFTIYIVDTTRVKPPSYTYDDMPKFASIEGLNGVRKVALRRNDLVYALSAYALSTNEMVLYLNPKHPDYHRPYIIRRIAATLAHEIHHSACMLNNGEWYDRDTTKNKAAAPYVKDAYCTSMINTLASEGLAQIFEKEITGYLPYCPYNITPTLSAQLPHVFNKKFLLDRFNWNTYTNFFFGMGEQTPVSGLGYQMATLLMHNYLSDTGKTAAQCTGTRSKDIYDWLEARKFVLNDIDVVYRQSARLLTRTDYLNLITAKTPKPAEAPLFGG
ncbi:MAG: hypothetical protein EOM37_00230 [Proteobacteria bacterium]|nr:hypothetical protein [Pseudomonadota bacterium]